MRAAKTDANQSAIVAALRKVGCSVACTHTVGAGFPDLVVALNARTFLVEVKDGAKVPSAQKLTPDQVIWHAEWKAEVHVVNSIDGALAVAKKYRELQA